MKPYILRVTRSKDRAKSSYDKLSKWYDLLANPFEGKFSQAALEKLKVTEGETVVEIGFGTGYCISELANSVGKSGKVFGIDISAGMLDRAWSRLKKVKLSERVILKLGDAAKLPFKDSFADAILISFTLELFDTPEIPNVLNKCRRILKKDGRICIVSLSKNGRFTLMTRLYEWAHVQFPNYFDCRPIYVREEIETAGFTILDANLKYMVGLPIEIVLAQKGEELRMTINVTNTGAVVTITASILMPIYWILFALVLPMREKYIRWVTSQNWIWVNSIGFIAAIAGIFAALFIAVYLKSGLLNVVSAAAVIAGSLMLTSLLYFEAYILPSLARNIPELVDQSGSLYTYPSFEIIRWVGSILFSAGFIVWGIAWLLSGRLYLWSSLCIIIGAPLMSFLFIPGNIRLVGILLYSAGLFGAGLKMLIYS